MTGGELLVSDAMAVWVGSTRSADAASFVDIGGGASETLILDQPSGAIGNAINGFSDGDNIEFLVGDPANSPKNSDRTKVALVAITPCLCVASVVPQTRAPGGLA